MIAIKDVHSETVTCMVRRSQWTVRSLHNRKNYSDEVEMNSCVSPVRPPRIVSPELLH